MRGVINSTQDLGRAVVAARRKHGLTQVQLAEALEVTQRYVSELETGKSRTLSPRLFDVLDQMGIQLEFKIADDD